MADEGFAIRCPHCGKWNVWPDVHPEEIALSTQDDFEFIMTEFHRAKHQRRTNEFSHKKLFRCKRPRWSCPASFEAFVFKDEKEALKSLDGVPDAWDRKDFRLFKADKRNRWDKKNEQHYFCIMLCTEEVPRQGSVEFEHLMDRRLLSRAILGIGCEIEAPLTIYAANTFEPREESPTIYWMPIEEYSASGEPLVPPRYNEFCRAVRKTVIEQIVKEFSEEMKVSPGNCPLSGFGDGQNNTCAGRPAACLARDWNHCPAFIKEREQRCPCYNSDREIIRQLETMWDNKTLTLDSEAHRCGIAHQCHAKFNERAFPIIVHDRLAAVAMTGQVFFDEQELVRLKDFKTNWPDLIGADFELGVSQSELVIGERGKRAQKGEATFLKTEREFNERLKKLEPNVAKIEEMADIRYRDIRTRSEDAFRQEILAYVRRFKKARNFFIAPVLNVLRRMREFWAFRAVGFLCYSDRTKNVCVISYGHETEDGIEKKGFGFPGEQIGPIDFPYRQRYPVCWFYDPDESEQPRNPWISCFLPLLEDARNDPNISLPDEGCYFLVAVPFGAEVYIFAFLDRDSGNARHTGENKYGSASELCREFMLRNCTEVIHEFADVRALTEYQDQPETGKKAPFTIEAISKESKNRDTVSKRDDMTRADSEPPNGIQG